MFDPYGLSITCWPWGCKGDADLPPTDKTEPEKTRKPKRPTCVNSTTNFVACTACCNTVRGNLASGGGSLCHVQCAEKEGIVMKDSEIQVCGI